MKGFIGLLGLAALAFGLWSTVEVESGGLRVEQNEVHLETDDLEVRFWRAGPVSESYMIFGGNNDQLRNSLTHAIVGALPIEEARLIHQSHPDFHLCKSPGAAQAKRFVQTVSFIADGWRARRALIKAVDVHDERVRGGGERTCLTVAGERVSLESVRVKANGADFTAKIKPTLDQQRMILARQAEIVDCQDLLR